MFSIAITINSGATNSHFSCLLNIRFSYVGRTFCSVLMCCTSVFSGTSPLLVRRYPLIDHLLSGTQTVNFRFSCYMPGARTVIA